MDRPIQAGDFARVILDNESQTYPIELIEGNNIYISVADGESSVLIPLNGEYQVRGLGVNHQVEFLANDVSALTGVLDLDLALLEELDDKDLEVICQVSDYVKELCEGDQLWINKTISKYGQTTFNQKPHDMKPREYYSLIQSVDGANLALVRNDQPLLRTIVSQGYSPDINLHIAHRFNGMNMRRLTQDATNFLLEADLGPQVTGSFNHNTRDFSTVKTFKAVEGTRLQDILWFLQPEINGQPNPLYRNVLNSIFREYDIFKDLLALHLYHSRSFKCPNYTATSLMRKYLGNVMTRIIDADVNRIKQLGVEAIKKVQRQGFLAEQAIELLEEQAHLSKLAIKEPNLDYREHMNFYYVSYDIFNPNAFGRYAFNRFFDYVYEPGQIPLTPQFRDEVFEVYSPIFDSDRDEFLDILDAIERYVIILADKHRETIKMPIC